MGTELGHPEAGVSHPLSFVRWSDPLFSALRAPPEACDGPAGRDGRRERA